MKDRRAPVLADVSNALQVYLLLFSTVIIIAESCTDLQRMLPRLLATAAVFVAFALVARLTDSKVIIILSAVLLPIGCTALGGSFAECALLAVMGLAALACCLVIRRRTRRDGVEYKGMFFLVMLFPVLILISDTLGQQTAGDWQYGCSLLYLPLCIVSWHLSRSEYSLQVFDGRTAQPISLIRRRTYGTLLTVLTLVLLGSLLLPGRGGENVLYTIFRVTILGFLLLVVKATDWIPGCFTEPPAVISELAPVDEQSDVSAALPGVPDKEPNTTLLYIVYGVVGVVLLVLLVRLAVRFIKVAARMTRSLLGARGEQVTDAKMTEYDTVEHIDRSELDNRREPLRARTASERVRRIYKKRVERILEGTEGEITSCTPDEIAALCEEKGEDIRELTALYKKARYTDRCTAQDVRAARRLV